MILLLTTVFFVVGGITAPGLATSDRLLPEAGYAGEDVTMEDTGRNYSGGMDLVRAQVASGTAEGAPPIRCFLKAEDTLDWMTYTGTVKVMLYDYRGALVEELVEVDPGEGVYAGTAKLNPAGDTIWFSDTKNGSTTGSYYSMSADLDTMTFGAATEQFVLPGAWEVEWPPAGPRAGTAFFVGKESDYNNDPHAIFIRNGSAWQKVVEIGGFSNGIAFDNAGNLWCGSYTTSGPSSQQYAYVFTASDVDTAITTGTPLEPGDAYHTIDLPMTTYDGEDYFTGPNDFECDPDGNVYITLNGGFDWVGLAESGFVVMLPNNGNSLPDPATDPYTAADFVYLSKTDPSSGWDWQKQLAFDGPDNIDVDAVLDDANILYVDQDYGWGSGGPDIVTALSVDSDSDSDGVADAVDNAYLTENSNQIDADQDGYGNVADADLDNSGTVDGLDYVEFKNRWRSDDPAADFDSSGVVDGLDYTTLKGNWREVAPYY